MADRVNVLYITTDQQRWDTIAYAGYPHMVTPNLDALASGGILFNSAYVPCPVCCPSRASMVTGMFPRRHGVTVNGVWIPSDEDTWPRAFTEAGYDTCAIGKMHAAPWDNPCGFARRVIAEDKYFGSCDQKDDYAVWLENQGAHRPQFWRDPRYIDEYKAGHAALVWPWAEERHIDSFIGSNAVEELRRAVSTNGPFCHWVSFNSPHAPIDPPRRFLDLYEGRDVPAPERRAHEPWDKPASRAYVGKLLEVWLNYNCDVYLMDEEAVKTRRRYYYATISLVDHWVGEIVRALKEAGVYENTIIIFTSDHGEALADNNLFEKGFFYEGMVRVPLIVHCPATLRPRVSDEFIELTDIAPTLLGLAGLPVPEGLDGRDLTPFLNEKGGWESRDAVFSEDYWMGRPMTMVRTRDWKLVYEDEPTCCELYDMQNDPGEHQNVYHEPEHRRVRDDLVARVQAWRA